MITGALPAAPAAAPPAAPAVAGASETFARLLATAPDAALPAVPHATERAELDGEPVAPVSAPSAGEAEARAPIPSTPIDAALLRNPGQSENPAPASARCGARPDLMAIGEALPGPADPSSDEAVDLGPGQSGGDEGLEGAQQPRLADAALPTATMLPPPGAPPAVAMPTTPPAITRSADMPGGTPVRAALVEASPSPSAQRPSGAGMTAGKIRTSGPGTAAPAADTATPADAVRAEAPAPGGQPVRAGPPTVPDAPAPVVPSTQAGRSVPVPADPAAALLALVESTPAAIPVARSVRPATAGRTDARAPAAPPSGIAPPLGPPAAVPALPIPALPIPGAPPAEVADTREDGTPGDPAPLAATASQQLAVAGAAMGTAIAPAPPTVADLAAAAQLDLAAGNQWLDRLAQDITRAADTNGDLRFQLAPPNLGRLHVAIAMQADGAAIRLTTETPEAQRILHEAQPVLVAEARAQGLRVAETHVDLGQAKFEGAGGGTGYSHNPQQQADGRQPRAPQTPPQPARTPAPTPAEDRPAADVTAPDHLYA